MPYIGRELDSGNYLKLDDISSSFNGSTKTFNLTAGGKAFFPGSAFSILVNLAGVAQEPEAAYQINNSQITFASAPASGDQFFCIVLGVAHGVNVPGNGTVDGAQLKKPFNYDGYFYLDDVNNRVGVGTATPGKPLHVVGEGQFDSVRVLGDLTVDGTTTTLDTVVTEVDRLEVGANNNTVGLALTQSGSGHAAIFMGGDVGIGTVNPAEALEVYGNGRFKAADGSHGIELYPDVAGLGYQRIISYNRTSSAYENLSIGVSSFVVTTGSSDERLRITSAGKVGIGTNNPGVKLDLNGTASIRMRNPANTNYAQINCVSESAATAADFTIAVGTGEALRIQNDGKIGVGSATPQSQFEVYGTSPIVRSKHSTSQKYTQINHNGTDGYLDWSSGNLILRGASSAERLRIDSSGKVGIGTDNPSHQLDVFLTGRLNKLGQGGYGLLVGPSTTTGGFTYMSTGDIEISTSQTSKDIVFSDAVGGNQRMRLTGATGRLGIGTDDPLRQLEIFSTGHTTAALKGSTQSSLFFVDNDDSNIGQISYMHSGSPNNYMYFRVNDAERLRITSDGQLLVNKTTNRDQYYGGTYTGLLQVEGTDDSTRLTQFIHNTNAASQPIVVLGKSRGTSVGSYTVVQNGDYLGTLSFQGADGDEMIEGARIDAIVSAAPGADDMPTSLSFGVTADGAASPTERLKIHPTGWQESNATYDTVGINTFASWARTGGAIRGEVGYNAVTTDYMYFGTGTNHPLALRVNNDTALYIKNDANRNVGIGTDNPDYNLHVYGAGDILIEDSANGSAHLRLRSSNGGTDVSNWKIKTSSNNFLYIENDTVGGQSQFTINNSGKVGINDPTPSVSLDLASNTDALSLPTGTTAQRPTGTDAYIRKNSTNNSLEFYNGTEWVEIITDYFPTGSTILG